jgi:hypothetical protein
MNMFAAFLTRKEEESEAFSVKDSWTHVQLLLLVITQFLLLPFCANIL